MSIPPPPEKKPNAKLAALNLTLDKPAEKPKPKAKAKPVPAITAADTGELKPLNFKVPPEFKRRFKMYALERDTTMVEILMATLTQLMDDDE